MLSALGFDAAACAAAERRGRMRGTGAAEQLVAEGRLDPRLWWRALAEALRVGHLARVDLPEAPADAPPPAPDLLMRARQAWLPAEPLPLLVTAPSGEAVGRLAAAVAADPHAAARIRISAPAEIRASLLRAHAEALTRRAVTGPAALDPRLSAASVRLGPIRLALAVAAILAGILAAGVVGGTLVVLALAQILFAGLGLLRLLAALEGKSRPVPPPLAEVDLPRYAVLVPLHREPTEVARLVTALKRLDYPADRLALRLVVEADDEETLRVARRECRDGRVEIVEVPPSHPRTKPKALNFALAAVEAEIVAVFDAEDRPDPDQLRRAAAAFAQGPADLVCVQAELTIDHATASRPWIARQFALEYAMLFRGLLPWLSARGLWFPLGGTSNHFRMDALRAAGGWDAHNVTEDADIAVRLARRGGRLATLASATAEEAPLDFSAWRAQRRRWMKGWMQTWIVHMRRPARLWRELGPAGFLLFQVLMAGQVLSALLYPVGLAVLVTRLAFDPAAFADRPLADDLVLALCLVGFAIGFGGAWMLGSATRRPGDIARPILDLATLPVYWLLLCGAVIGALVELVRDPHGWNKTRHGIARRDDPLAEEPGETLLIGDGRV